MKLGPFLLFGYTSGCVRNMNFVVLGLVCPLAGDVDELEDKWSSRDDAATTRKKVSANYIFENRGLSGRLGADNDLDVTKRLEYLVR